MPSHPKISAALNNCPLHVLTPELRSDIANLAENEGVLPATFKSAYETLKAQFLAFYLPDRTAPCSWQEFHKVLGSYNAFDIQILFGPVLREFMAENMRARNSQMLDTYGMNEDELGTFISSKTSLQENGRYVSLSPDEVFVFVAVNFGLKLTYHQGDQMNTFPNDGTLDAFEGRPTVAMFHQGGVEGACAGGHWERTADEAEQMEYAQESNAHLHMVAGLFRQDSLEVTQAGFDLLRSHVALVFAANHSPDDFSELFDNFNLTTAQIEKFLYNRLWVRRPDSSLLLGRGTLTEHAQTIIASFSDLESIEYDQGLSDLLHLHQPDSETHNALKKQHFTYHQYQVALTLLTPAVPQISPHTHERLDLWPLRANEISALQSITNEYAQRIVFDQGLSLYLYELCNQPEIASLLSPPFIELLLRDPDFSRKAKDVLKASVNHHFHKWSLLLPLECPITPYANPSSESKSGLESSDGVQAPPNSPLDTSSVRRTLFPESPNPRAGLQQSRRLGLAYQDHYQPVASTWNTYFWLRAMQVFLALGGICAVMAVLTCPPAAAALGITTVFGVAASEIAVTATFLAGTSALLAASFFVVRLSEGESRPVTNLLEFRQQF